MGGEECAMMSPNKAAPVDAPIAPLRSDVSM